MPQLISRNFRASRRALRALHGRAAVRGRRRVLSSGRARLLRGGLLPGLLPQRGECAPASASAPPPVAVALNPSTCRARARRRHRAWRRAPAQRAGRARAAICASAIVRRAPRTTTTRRRGAWAATTTTCARTVSTPLLRPFSDLFTYTSDK